MSPPSIALAPEDPRRRPIAVFDSGVGGLTVLHECSSGCRTRTSSTSATPRASPTATARRRLRVRLEIAEDLLARRTKLLVVACNSRTAAALPALRERRWRRRSASTCRRRPAGAVQAVAATRNGRVGLLATPATVASGAYARALAAADPHVELTAVACPELGRRSSRAASRSTTASSTRSPLLRAAARGGRRHRDPRLHPLPAGRARCSSARSAATSRSSPRARRSPPGRARARRAAGSPTRAGRRGRLPLPLHGDPDAFRALGTRFLQLPLGQVEHVELRADGAAA